MFVAVALCGLVGSAQVARAAVDAGAAPEDVRPPVSLPRLFMVEAASEGCQVKRPGSEKFEAMVRRKAYPFGSVIEVRKGGSAALALSSGVRVAVGESTQVTLHGSEDEFSPYRVEVASGQVVVTVQKGEGVLPLAVESVAGVVEAIQGQVDVRVRSRSGVYRMGVAVSDGTAAVSGTQFNVAEMKRNVAVEVEAAQDKSYTRLITRSGMVEVSADRGVEEAEAVRLQVGQTLTISRSPVKGQVPDENRNAVSVIVAGPEGILLQYVFMEGGVAEVTVSKAETASRSADGDAVSPAGQEADHDGDSDQGASSATAVKDNNWDDDNW